MKEDKEAQIASSGTYMCMCKVCEMTDPGSVLCVCVCVVVVIVNLQCKTLLVAAVLMQAFNLKDPFDGL